MLKVCPICETVFECLHDDIQNCQCSKLSMSEPLRTYLEEHYKQHCVCGNCIKKLQKNSIFAVKPAKPNKSSD